MVQPYTFKGGGLWRFRSSNYPSSISVSSCWTLINLISKISSMRNQLLTTGPPLILFQPTLKFKFATFIVSFACSHFSGKFSIYNACEVSSKELHIASRLLLENSLLLSWFQDNKVLRNQIGLEVIQNWEHSYAFHTTRAPLSPRSFHRRFQIWLEFIGTVSKTFSSSFKWNGVKRFWPNWVFGPHSLKREYRTSVWNKRLKQVSRTLCKSSLVCH